ncbi:MAG: hypothetical protein R8G33_02300 [Gammaproteobacteria bacterium]|nr:hypothetical protein [Gammaproteobacteria bacterium]
MGRFVTVHKAATLVGISARDLQSEIDTGRLPCVRGMVHIDDLTELHPNVSSEEADMVMWVNKIKDSSLQHATEKLPHELTKNELRQMLSKASKQLSYQRDKIESYESLINELRYSLEVLKEKSSEPNKIQSVIAWLDKKSH